jgi:hypothetical protein
VLSQALSRQMPWGLLRSRFGQLDRDRVQRSLLQLVDGSSRTRSTKPCHASSTQQTRRGSIRLKIEAACRFVNRTGKLAAISALSDAVAIIEGQAGTRIVPESTGSPIGATEHAYQWMHKGTAELKAHISQVTRRSAHKGAR